MSDKDFIKVEKQDSIQKFRDVGALVQKGEAKWYGYMIEGEKGYHYYMVLTNNKK